MWGAVPKLPVGRSTRSWVRLGLLIQGGENPLLQDGSKVGFDFAKYQTHARGLDIEDGCFGLKILT